MSLKTLFVLLISISVFQAKAITAESNLPAPVIEQLKSDLQFVKSIKGSKASKLHQSIFGKVDGSNYDKWFRDRIETIGYDAKCEVAPGAIAYNIAPLNNIKLLRVTDYYVKGHLPQAARIAVLFHEARHSEAENGYWMHNICPNPYLDEHGVEMRSLLSGLSLSGKPACDPTYSGAYGVESIMLLNISRFCSNCSEKMKMDTALYGTDPLGRLEKISDRNLILSDIHNTH